MNELKIPFSWQERRPILLEKLLYIPGHYEKHQEWAQLPWSDPTLFGNEQPVVVEFCSGNGQWIGEKALQNPHLNWVAVEKLFERARKIWYKIQREKIPNLIVVWGEALPFTRYYAPMNSIAEAYVNFPDPWPKLRHAKHRLLRAPFFEALEKIVKPGGQATCATDDWAYASFALEEWMKCPGWRPKFPHPFYATEWPDYGNSFFANLWSSKGRSTYYLSFERNS